MNCFGYLSLLPHQKHWCSKGSSSALVPFPRRQHFKSRVQCTGAARAVRAFKHVPALVRLRLCAWTSRLWILWCPIVVIVTYTYKPQTKVYLVELKHIQRYHSRRECLDFCSHIKSVWMILLLRTQVTRSAELFDLLLK